jgi:hypothetical protein
MYLRWTRTAAILLAASFASDDLPAQPAPPLAFEEVSQLVGVKRNLGTYGASWVDIDGDGRLDLYVGNHQASPPSLFFQRANGTFDNRGKILYDGPDELKKKDRHGAGFADIDNDGDLDLYHTVGAGGGSKVLPDDFFRYDVGTKSYVQIRKSSGADDATGRGRGVGFADYDGDGFVDMFLANEALDAGAPSALFHNNGNRTFTNVSAAAGLVLNTSLSGGLGWTDYDLDGRPDLFLSSALHPDTFSLLFRNQGDGTFADVTAAAGLGDLNWGRAPLWFDYDNDGDLDLLITRANGSRGDNAERGDEGIWWSASELYALGVVETADSDVVDGIDFATTANSITVEFPNHPAPPASQVYIGAAKKNPASLKSFVVGGTLNPNGMPSFSPGDDKGVFIWRDGSGWHVRASAGPRGDLVANLRITPRGAGTTITSASVVDMEDYFTDFSKRLYRNNGDGTLTDVTAAAGLHENRQGGGMAAVDFDNDGDTDLFVVNVGYNVNGAKPYTLYLNNDDGTFTESNAFAAGFEDAFVGTRGVAAAGDYDADGKVDLFVTGGFGPLRQKDADYRLYRNRTTNGNHWLEIKLVGTTSNRQGLGARVTVEAGGRSFFKYQGGGHSLYGQHSAVLHYGLGTATSVDRITVTWPSGQEQILTGPDFAGVDQVRTVTEP